jgi:ABC-2 type transport system ATP-binding protein
MTSLPAPSLETRDLTRRFGSFTAVDRLSLRVEAGEIFGFLGANGAGKTTAIRMLCGLLQPSGGTGTVAGCDLATQSESLRARIGYMSQKFALYPDFTLEQNLRLYGGLYGLDRDPLKRRIAEMAERLNLGPLLARRTDSIPWGWQQRLNLACALLHKPRILFLDEPTASVDPVSRRTFWDLIAEVAREGTTVFVTSHYMDEVEYCGRVAILVAGRIAAQGSPAELKRDHGKASLGEVFLEVVEAAEDKALTPGPSPQGRGEENMRVAP